MVNLMYKTHLTKTLKRLVGCVLIYNLQLLLVLAVVVVMMLVNWISLCR